MHEINLPDRILRRFFAAVFLSGVAGLVYQVVWHKYLAILLGSHARATAAILAVFLGGLGVGYGLFGGWSVKRRGGLLILFAYIELALGTYALLFPYLFRAAFAAAPGLDGVFGVNSPVTDLLLAVLLIGPPTVLMGGTLPLLTQALSGDVKAASLAHARIYAFNTLGAAAGALLGGYLLIPLLGLPVSLRAGALLNIMVGGAVYSFVVHSLEADSGERLPAAPFLAGYAGLSAPQLRLILIGLLSGFYVLTLETLLIRLMGLSTGSSGYHFALIVSIFILGLGLAPLAARRIAEYTPGHLFGNQVAVTVLLLAVYLSGDFWPYAAHLLRIPFREQTQNYYLYQALLGATLTAFLIVPIGACGLTLPVCFHLLKDRRDTLGHRTGLLYAANTAGSVLGGLLGGYVLFYFANIDTLFKVVVAAAAATAAAAAFSYRREGSARRLAAGLLTVLAALVVALAAPPYHKDNYIQPFRQAQPGPGSYDGPSAFRKHLARNMRHIFYEDGPNTSVGIGVNLDAKGEETGRSILVNGKSDGNTSGDRFTTMMLGHLPALLAARPERACVIGFGTGITAGVLARYGAVRTVDIIEISPVVRRAAHLFDAYNGEVTKNPKIEFREMDAFRFLLSAPERFDLIVSEPSNPWVQGVENLYSTEFYRIAKRRLADDGLFVQWIHVYSFTDDLFRTVLRTMGGEFPYVSVFQLGKGDRAVIGHFRPFALADLERSAKRMRDDPAAAAALRDAGLTEFHAVAALEVAPPGINRTLAAGALPQTLENPHLSRRAALAFFAEEQADIDVLRRSRGSYFSSVQDSMLSRYAGAHAPTPGQRSALRASFCEHATSKLDRFCKETLLLELARGAGSALESRERKRLHPQEAAAAELFATPARNRPPQARLAEIDEMLRLLSRVYSPLARLPLARLEERLDACVRAVASADAVHGECLIRRMILAKMLDAAKEDYIHRRDEFQAWFARLAPATPDYEKYRRLREDPSDQRLKKYFKQLVAALPPLPKLPPQLR
ncbi:MAG: hypothetical protein ABIJ96_03455 [Elusimicrobiota bacterium]